MDTPIEKASRIALTMVKEFLEREGKLDKVIFVLFTRHDFEIYMEAAREIL
jgi:O-acetyl-ADP-ribose deacetylase (regulator of RNase III)